MMPILMLIVMAAEFIVACDPFLGVGAVTSARVAVPCFLIATGCSCLLFPCVELAINTLLVA